MQPPLAALLELEVRIPGGIEAGDAARAEAALDDASALVRAEAGKTWVTDGELDDDVPDIIVSITLLAAKRSFINPEGIRGESIDGFQTNFDSSSPDVYLTAQEKSSIRQAVGKGGLWTQPTTRSDPEVSTIFLETEPPGDPIPWAPSPDLF